MIQRPWHRAAAVILSGGLLGILVPAAASAQPSPTPSPEPLPLHATPGPQLAIPELAFPELPFPGFPSSKSSVSDKPGVAVPEPDAPAAQATNLGTPALAMLGIAGQGVRVPIPQL
ncbi:MAG: hypothetical protein ACRD2C_20230 [Acidimicrobiales bacterium]